MNLFNIRNENDIKSIEIDVGTPTTSISLMIGNENLNELG